MSGRSAAFVATPSPIFRATRPCVCELTTVSPGSHDVRSGPLILLSTQHWVAINKPSGMLVHRTKLSKHVRDRKFVVDLLREELRQHEGRDVPVFPVHRLDRCTSGVMLFAIGSSDNASKLQAALKRDEAEKIYWAIASGAEMPVHWINDHPLKDLQGPNRQQRPARTEFTQLLRLDVPNVSVVRARLYTGRRHQIRRHLSNSRHPILGDTTHANGALNREAREKYGVTRCCLHSHLLTFSDPVEERTVRVGAPVPEDLRSVLAHLPGYVPLEHDKELHLT